VRTYVDLTGSIFGRLTVMRRIGGKIWLCHCKCGGIKEATTGNLRAGHTTSCGCLQKEKRIALEEEFIGKVFDHLTPTAFVDGWVVCQCVCGEIARVRPRNLRLREVKSCGCKRGELIGVALRTHGQSSQLEKTAEYTAWQHMRQRCLNPDDPAYRNYGGRGITIHSPWIDSFESFFEYVGPKPSPKHSIDRIDNNGNYEPGNVRWATSKQQRRNTQRSKLDEIDLRFIRHWLKRGYRQKDIAAAFGVHKAHVANINRGAKWATDR